MLHVADPHQLGVGRDAHTYHRNYHGLQFYTAWRVEHPDMWREFDSRRLTMKSQMKQLARQGLACPNVRVQPAMASGLPGSLCLEVNETYLLSGTKPEHLLAILHNGLNPKLSALSGAFGAGVYLAEEAAKIDQYTTPDSSYEQDQLDELHARQVCTKWH